MKTKQILLIMAIFGAIIISMAIMPNAVLAMDVSDGMADLEGTEIENPMSDTFKKILNEEGKLVVTDTSHKETQEFLNEYLQKYFAEDGSYTFLAENYNENNNGKHTVEISLWHNGEERHEVEVVYNEQISEKFNKYLKNGKLSIPTSLESGKADFLNQYTIVFNDDSTIVQAFNINEECTSCTLQMRYKGKVYETHIVPIVFVTEKSKEFKKLLNEDDKIVFNSRELTAFEEFVTYIDITYDGKVSLYDVASDFSSCTLTLIATGETHEVDVVYNYNKETLEKMKEFVKKFPADREFFKVQDLELINYWVNNSDKEDTDTFTNYSGELKGYLNYNNIDFEVMSGAGGDMPYVTERIGNAIFKVNGITYYVHSFLGAKGEHILYVPNDTGDTKEELMAAAQKRVDEYLGKSGIVEISYAGTAEDCLYKYSYEFECKYFYQPGEQIPTYEQWLFGNQMAYEDFGRDVAMIEGVKADDPAFKVKVKYGENKDREYCILIQKDSSKMVEPEYKTVDVYTNIEISSNSSEIPLDTSITAKKVTSGDEYDNIIKILDVENSVTFDLKLYSDSTGDITKLEKDEDEFEVRIPISKELEGKELIVYFVDENNKVSEYEVTAKDGYAVFTTNHFSIYTLAEKKEEVYKVVFEANGGKFANNSETLVFEKWVYTDYNNLEKPTRDGYKFEGYFTKEGLSFDKYYNEAGVDKDMILYAKWEKIADTENTTTDNNTENNIDNTITNDTTNSTNNSNNPQTGDAIWIFATILLVSVIGIVITTVFKKENK